MEESTQNEKEPEELRVVSEVNPFFVLAGEVKPLQKPSIRDATEIKLVSGQCIGVGGILCGCYLLLIRMRKLDCIVSGQMRGEYITFSLAQAEEKNSKGTTNNLEVNGKKSFPLRGLWGSLTNKIARLQFLIPKSTSQSQNRGSGSQGVSVDEDGDLIVRRRGELSDLEESVMFIEYENSTKLEAVGLQVWRGALLLADHIIANVDQIYKGKTILELGAGTGLTSIVAAMYAQRVIATDLNEYNILDLIKSNVQHNETFLKSDFHIEPLDFTNLSWSPKLEEFIAQSDVILAADVVYHERITQAFVATLKKIVSTGTKSKDIFIAMEKRYVFTITDLDTVAPMFSHFVDELESVLNLSASSKSSPATAVIHRSGSTSTRLAIQQIPLSFPQYFNYERTKELVLWHLSSSVTQ